MKQLHPSDKTAMETMVSAGFPVPRKAKTVKSSRKVIVIFLKHSWLNGEVPMAKIVELLT